MEQTAKELTAVEWLMREFQEVGYISFATYEQAKEMEKQQSIDFACEVYNSHYYRDTKSFKQVSEEHYIKTYKKQEQ